jgi:hypothetical protein
MTSRPRPLRARLLAAASACLLTSFALPGSGVSTDVQMPGTQPGESTLIGSAACTTCHGGYDAAVEPARNWKGSMMAHASRDPVFWAGLAIAQRGYPEGGDTCLRCHVNIGWVGGRSVPTDGSALLASDADGVSCYLCHSLTNPDQSEHLGVQNAPYIANDGAEGFYGAGQYVLWNGTERLGPYSDPVSPHPSLQSLYHRKPELCGTCHDVSNPVTGDLAHNNGAQMPLAPGTFSDTPGAPVTQKAAFLNPPYAYGIVERTYSENAGSLLSQTRVSDYPLLPADLQGGAIQRAYDAAMASTVDGDYADGAPRTFTCQTCHMPPVTGKGCTSGSAPTRSDLPLHDLTGGNYWAPDAIAYLDGLGRLRLGGGLSAADLAAMADGKARAIENLQVSGALSVTGNTLKVVNQTGHKLITGYPEGRRMWLDVKWHDRYGALLREDGAYGDMTVDVDGSPTTVRSILDLDDPNLRIYEVDSGMTQEWASELLTLGTPASLPIEFDRVTGAVVETIGSLAAAAPGTAKHSFHFILNNTVLGDTRIPPYGMTYDEAERRNMLPVPASQYGNPGPGGTYDYFDLVPLNPPAGAAWATIDLLYQPTSWEYVQFLDLANDGSNAFLATVGDDIREAWFATGMAEPVAMASTTWSAPGELFVPFCSGDGSGTACPCGNAGLAGHGCDNSQGTGGAELSATGIPALNDVALQGTSLPASTMLVAIRSDQQAAGGDGVVFGDGLRCLATPLRRIKAGATVAGLVSLPIHHGAGPGTYEYQLWYRNNPASFCSPDAFNLSNGLEIVWP